MSHKKVWEGGGGEGGEAELEGLDGNTLLYIGKGPQIFTPFLFNHEAWVKGVPVPRMY